MMTSLKRERAFMKLISKGLVNRILSEVDEKKLQENSEAVDNMTSAFRTETNPYGKNPSVRNSVMRDPHLFIAYFHKIL